MAKIRTLINRIRGYFKTIIVVNGGVAEVYRTPFFTDVLIFDFDNNENLTDDEPETKIPDELLTRKDWKCSKNQ